MRFTILALSSFLVAAPAVAFAHPGHEHVGNAWLHHGAYGLGLAMLAAVVGGLLWHRLMRTRASR